MSLIQELSVLAIRQVLADRAESILGFLGDRYSDHSRRLEAALHKAGDRAWRTLEVALAGTTWWDRCQELLTPREDQVFRTQIQAFLESAAAQMPEKPRFRQYCLAELRAARRAGLIPGTDLRLDKLGDPLIARYGSHLRLVELQWDGINGLAGYLRYEGFVDLALCVSRPVGGELPLLVLAVGYFFRRELESDPQLSAGLTLERLQKLDAAQEAGFRHLQEALLEREDRFEALLGGVHGLLSETHDDVRALQILVARQEQEIHALHQTLLRLLEQRAETPIRTAPEPACGAPPVPDQLSLPSVQMGRRRTTLPVADPSADREQEDHLPPARDPLPAEEAGRGAEVVQPASRAETGDGSSGLISNLFLQARVQRGPEPAPEQAGAQPPREASPTPLLSQLFSPGPAAAAEAGRTAGKGPPAEQQGEGGRFPSPSSKGARLRSPLFGPPPNDGQAPG